MAQKFLNKDFFFNNEKISAGLYMEHREINMHSHEFWEISYVYEGAGTHHFDSGKASAIKESEFIFMSPGTAHCITSPTSKNEGWVRVCNLLLTQEYIDLLSERLLSMREFDEYALKNMILNKTPFCVQLSDEYSSIYSLLMTTVHEYRHYTYGSNEIIENTVLSILIYIIRIYEKSIKNNAVTTTKNEIIDDLTRYIRSNFSCQLSLEYLAAYVHLSPEYLSRYFKKCTGINISDFISETRIEKAKYMLRTDNRLINDISEYCGYKSISNFQKAFKKSTGMSAGEYRKLFM